MIWPWIGRARQILDEAAVQRKFSTGAWLFGAWIGAVVGTGERASIVVERIMNLREANVACARCFEFCPNEWSVRDFADINANETDVATIPGTLAEGK
jgi:hypothetical protein